jgi:adenylate cyclase
VFHYNCRKLGTCKVLPDIKGYFPDLSGAVIDHAGAIYQYLDDEVILTWKLKGGLKANNSAECFFPMKRTLELPAQKYYSNLVCYLILKRGGTMVP